MEDRFETIDGSCPSAPGLAEVDGAALPLTAFAVLRGGDVFEPASRTAPRGADTARAWREARVQLLPHGAPKEQLERVERDLERLVAANPSLAARLSRAK